ncbi:MAG: hypothetical protein RBG13Loki_0715 [Promethearchaeota archaeon CR_4]|nr:MAG: hypothetical protein RBG13Loki_0715 [Candidatus Lokiarchaeota archaeon CR_4]
MKNKGRTSVPEAKGSARDKIIAFFEKIPSNEPVAIKEIELATGLSWPAIKGALEVGKLNIHFKKSANTWIAWKSTAHVGEKLEDTCAKFRKEPDPTAEY